MNIMMHIKCIRDNKNLNTSLKVFNNIRSYQWLMTWWKDASFDKTWAFASSQAQFFVESFGGGQITRAVGRSPSFLAGRLNSIATGFKMPWLVRKKRVRVA
jgi:hypothetical protein